MTLPNTMIIGAQKCGTTWLHRALDKSEHFWGSQKKELNFWNRRNRELSEYKLHFDNVATNAKFIYESTPHYFRLPTKQVDTAAEIRKGLGDIPLILLLRDPVERYLSAYTHQIMQGRLPVVDVVDDIRDDYSLFSLGCYSKILQHFQAYFSRIHIFLYDQVVQDPMGLMHDVFSAFRVPIDLDFEDLNFRTNDKTQKRRRVERQGIVFPNGLPSLSKDTRIELKVRYSDDVRWLRDEVGLGVNHWLEC